MDEIHKYPDNESRGARHGLTRGGAGAQTVIERARAGGGDAGRQGEGGAGRGLASERPRGPPRRARSAPGPARGALPRGAGRRARASEAARTGPGPSGPLGGARRERPRRRRYVPG